MSEPEQDLLRHPRMAKRKQNPPELAGLELPDGVQHVLDAVRELEDRVLAAEQRADRAEAERAQLEEASRTDRVRNLQKRLESERGLRAEIAKLRTLHQAELTDVRLEHDAKSTALRADYESRHVDLYQSLQASEADNQELRLAVAQRDAALGTYVQQNTLLRKMISAREGEAGESLVTGIAGFLLGVVRRTSGSTAVKSKSLP
jgi:vacuolar-type H+-ATPase subunit I/STV1